MKKHNNANRALPVSLMKVVAVTDCRTRKRRNKHGKQCMPAKEKRWIIEICALDVYILICFQAIQKTF